MTKPNSIIYNYRANVISVQSPDSMTVLVDQGFRSWAMRQFRLAGVSCIDPRNYQKGTQRDFAKGKIVEQREILKSIVVKNKDVRTSILLAPEKPTYSGNFSANIFMPIVGNSDSVYVIKFADQHLFDICSFMRDVCSGVVAVDQAISFIKEADLRNFVR